MAFLADFVSAFVLLFFIMNPFASIPLFISLTRKFPERVRLKSADDAVIVAGALALIFLFFGVSLLSAFGVSLASFKVFGGVVLCLLALEVVLGVKLKKDERDVHVAAVIIATPMLTGPGVITSVIILSTQAGYATTLAALALTLLASRALLRNASRISSMLGESSLEVASKIIGLLLGAVGVEFIRAGVFGA